MSEIAELLESALRSNQNVLRQAAMRTLSRLPSTTTIRELLAHEAAAAIRELTLDDLASVLGETRAAGSRSKTPNEARDNLPSVDESIANVGLADEGRGGSREERIYRAIIDALSQAPKTIGQLATAVALETDELRGYLDWMKRSGRVVSQGRARATRYSLA